MPFPNSYAVTSDTFTVTTKTDPGPPDDDLTENPDGSQMKNPDGSDSANPIT